MRRLVVGVLVAGCGAHGLAPTGDGSGSNDGHDDAPIGDTSTADAAWTWQAAITNNWVITSVGAGVVHTNSSCASIPIAQEMWIDGFRLGSSATTADEHPLLVVTTDSAASGCKYDPLSTNDEMLYAGGFGPNNEVDLPSGTAVHITPAMGNLVLYDRLENDTGSTINGSTTIEVHQVADPSTVVHDVDMVLGGMGSLAISPTNTTATGHCHPTITAGYQWNIIGLWPHMHESGTHVTVSIAGTSLLDTDYSHLDEHWDMVPETLLDTGAELDVTCTMANATTALGYDEVKAESQGDTVCWTGIYKWPTGTDSATGAPYGPEACVQGIAPLH
jgi:hypothetical protein